MIVPEETDFAEPEPSLLARVDIGRVAGMEAPDLWLVLLLLALQCPGTANIPAQNPPRHQVNGIRGGSVLLRVSITSSQTVAKIEWKFQPQTGLTLVIAEFISGKLKRPNPRDRFGQRLEMADEATLRIVELEPGDRGVYKARVRLASAVVEEHSFHCTVHEPLPEPQIRHRLVSRTADACNVTLQCPVSEKGGINVSWRRGKQLLALEAGSDWYWLSAADTDLHLSWRPSSSDSIFTCLLSNPADQRSVSVDLLSICQSEGTGGNPAENPPCQVNGIRGGSALFPLMVPSTQRVDRIEWFFQGGSSPEILTATFRDGKLERQNTRDGFGQRLEMAGETRLRIRALEQEDSGLFKARVLFATAEIHEPTFRLTIFEPVPDPQIRHRLVSRTADACNVTLQCLAPERGGINVSWRRGKQLRALEGASDWYRLSAADTDLHLSWLPDSSDSTFTCLFSNPAEQRNVSFDLLSICQNEDGGTLLWLRLAILVGLLVQIVAVASLNILERMGQEQN
ncbi:T-lymphocyte surface antigen Ly-9-like [Eublepharis macularius]|uniref:T-lymphocyte surface antigen Ly-9-like n=1 Tax=Eublepharis macularius TaxID=481883 RepID=A0AA97J225_EUBMA|nr:T-lymphocyte surface antigen Ly-9-like [Eublepharis macularius]